MLARVKFVSYMLTASMHVMCEYILVYSLIAIIEIYIQVFYYPRRACHIEISGVERFNHLFIGRDNHIISIMKEILTPA